MEILSVPYKDFIMYNPLTGEDISANANLRGNQEFLVASWLHNAFKRPFIKDHAMRGAWETVCEKHKEDQGWPDWEALRKFLQEYDNPVWKVICGQGQGEVDGNSLYNWFVVEWHTLVEEIPEISFDFEALLSDKPKKPMDFGSPTVKNELLDEDRFLLTGFSSDETYGYTPENPIMVGGGIDGPLNERRFFNALTGPGGELLYYQRIGSGHSFNTKNSRSGKGSLDIYLVCHDGMGNQIDGIKLYINMYDSYTLKVPVGLGVTVV